ncbi:MAG: ATPase, T2SS/T4P/T4SS family [Vicinamibacterales bacterium]|jgi:type IV pilus assembly protein PilB|nr:ATPase, T2SS/T4P/T4SS family [Vicinamibacterales bacterium]HJN45330.1 ATPase, T2SS/T4P/T4SS family [Vicinamibacterales bacterium]|tara:strand:+ start:7281 stop:9167 length:1887 start_codon:yes stop_codon:yes gene_type:complete
MTNEELDDRLAELLTEHQAVTPPVLDRVQAFRLAEGRTLAGALCELRVVSEEVLSPLLGELTGARVVDPSLMQVYDDFIKQMNVLIPPKVVDRLVVFPAQMELNAIHVCMINPTDGWTVRALESLTGCQVEPLVCHEHGIRTAIDKHYAQYRSEPTCEEADNGREVAEEAYQALLQSSFDEHLKPALALISRNNDALQREPSTLEAIIRNPCIIRLVQQILCRAVTAGASDVHFEPTGDELKVRVRVDGALRTQHTLPSSAAIPLGARLKAMANVPIQLATEPLDARIGYDLVWGRGIDLRFSLVPAVTGEKIVLRALDRTRAHQELTNLGMDAETLAVIEQTSDLPNGLLLVTGPTGSGKSSTLYALLDRLNQPDACLLTAEDPVESRISGVTQVQCDEASDMSFVSALRSFLRQDPDVLMIGEIRDGETADIALKAALTGHLVLSTLHTNDAPGAVLRLLNMDLEPFLVASALRMIVAQRLLRRLCSACRRPARPGSELTTNLTRGLPQHARASFEGATIYEPVGCTTCGGSGYKGRTGIFEALQVTEPIEELIIARASAAAIRTCARRDGMRTLREAGLLKVAAGDTSISEVLEHTIADAEPATSTPLGQTDPAIDGSDHAPPSR